MCISNWLYVYLWYMYLSKFAELNTKTSTPPFCAYGVSLKYVVRIVPKTAHAAFDKAAHYFRMRITHIPVDPETRQVDTDAMWTAINKQTCMV